MSHVTDIIICFSGPSSSEEERIILINSLVEDYGSFNEVQSHAGGGKCFSPIVLMASFNYFCLFSFLEELEKMEWGGFYCAWIMVKEEDTAWDVPIHFKREELF